jgi:hypothetical protein
VALGPPPAVVARILAGLVSDPGLVKMVAEQPMTPVQVVVVLGTRIQQDPGQLPKVVETVVHVDDRVEAQPPVPDLLNELAARKRNGQIDVEGRLVRVG